MHVSDDLSCYLEGQQRNMRLYSVKYLINRVCFGINLRFDIILCMLLPERDRDPCPGQINQLVCSNKLRQCVYCTVEYGWILQVEHLPPLFWWIWKFLNSKKSLILVSVLLCFQISVDVWKYFATDLLFWLHMTWPYCEQHLPAYLLYGCHMIAVRENEHNVVYLVKTSDHQHHHPVPVAAE